MASGAKRIETRSWHPQGVHTGEVLAIHAAKGFTDMSDREVVHLCATEPYRSALRHAIDSGVLTTKAPDRFTFGDIPRGCVVAIATFYAAYRTESADCQKAVAQSVARGATHERAFGNYQPGRWAWVFVRVRPLLPPIPARGARGIWEWEAPATLSFAHQEARA